ncbi:DMT family transporter [Xenorhabdus sp. 18]|uniref:DMT family transporter n=1 Tax=Xenorhabdus doucetiae TaxID=351671 RepID=UPI00198F99EA|nr:DMT family transporter [Xenorhabdus sp. 18]MBD2797263.1 DMT family transporter [Xenorhabdus sp. 18]
MNKEIKTEKYGYFIAFCGGFILSFDVALIRAINLSSEQVSFWRSLSLSLPMICITIYSILSKRKKINKDMIFNKDVMLSSIFYGISSILFPVSAMLTSIANMLFIISTAPLWAGLFSWIFIREPINKVTFFSFTISLAGVLVVIFGSQQGFSFNPSVGDITALLTAITMAAAFVVGRSSKKNLTLSPSIGAIMSAIILYIFFDINFTIPVHKLSLVFLEGAIVVFIALSLVAKASRFIPSSHLGLFLLLETILGPLWVYLFFDEIPNIYAIIGGSVIFLALLVNSAHSIYMLNTKSSAT